MKVATILPIAYLNLEKGQPYHMALAHLLTDLNYFRFFREESRKGNFVLMDNGVVETGTPLSIEILEERAYKIGASEFILPDCLNDSINTLKMGEKALHDRSGTIPVMAVPQGRSVKEWLDCLNVMLKWPVKTIGISKFTREFISSRLDLLSFCKDLLNSDKEIHLLGCNYYNLEILTIENTFPNRIRGIDSGMATFYTQAGLEMAPHMDKPRTELDFNNRDLDRTLLLMNIYLWKTLCTKGYVDGGQK